VSILSLRLIVFTQGTYGERILENIKERAPPEWTIRQVSLPDNLPDLVDEPDKFVDTLDLYGEWNLVVYIGESPSAFSLLPTVLRRISAKAVVAPADDYSWLPLGLERQIREELERLDIVAVFPRTFCTLAPVSNIFIDQFTQKFGSPKLRIKTEGGIISDVEVLRGAPCGSTWFAADGLLSTKNEEATEKAGLLVQLYPCRASRRVDRFFSDAPIHVAGRVVGKAVDRALEQSR
jgi:hypothetical protein